MGELIEKAEVLRKVSECSPEKFDFVEAYRKRNGGKRPTFGDGIAFARQMITDARPVAMLARSSEVEACEVCRYEYCACEDMPCRVCMHNHSSKFEPHGG